jgi:hypothetical protein
MPVLNAAGKALTTPGTTQQPVWMTWGEVKRRIAKIMQGENDPDIMSDCEDHARWALHQMDLGGPWAFRRTTNVDIPLVDGVKAYALANTYFHADMVQLVFIQPAEFNEKVFKTLEWVDWDQFQYMASAQVGTGTPNVVTMHNAFDDGSLQIYPTPTEYEVDNYELRIHHYEQITKPDADTDVVQIPQQMIDTLVDGGRFRLLLEREPEGNRVMVFKALFNEGIRNARSLDRQQNNAPKDGAFRMELR